MDIPFTLLVAAPVPTIASDFLSGKSYSALHQGKDRLELRNKYFTGFITSETTTLPPWPALSPNTGLVFILSAAFAPQARALFTEHQSDLDSVEVKMIFSAEHTEELADLALDFEMEYETQDYESDTTMHVEDGEKTGLARVVEAVEVACASLVPRPEPVQETGETDLDDLEVFDELLAKVKAASDNAANLSDEERRQQAERMIMEVVQRLGLDPGT